MVFSEQLVRKNPQDKLEVTVKWCQYEAQEGVGSQLTQTALPSQYLLIFWKLNQEQIQTAIWWWNKQARLGWQMYSVCGALAIIWHFSCNRPSKLFRIGFLLMLASGLYLELYLWSLKKKKITKNVNFLHSFHCVCGNLSIGQILPAPEWFEPKKGLRGLSRMGVHPIVCPTRAPVWQTSVSSPASLTKFQGVPCQEVGGVGYLIALCAVTECNRNHCLRSTRGVSIERDKRVGWLWRSLSKSLFHTAFISPHSAQMNTSIFCLKN